MTTVTHTLPGTTGDAASETDVIEAAARGRLVHANLPVDSGYEVTANARQHGNMKAVRNRLEARFDGYTEVSSVAGLGGRILAEFSTYRDGERVDRRVLNFGRLGGVQLLLKQPHAVTTVHEYHHEVHTVEKAVNTDAKDD